MRSGYWDGWKGICILLVVAAHTLPLDSGPGVGASWAWYAGAFSYQLLTFPVAMFLAIAGYFSAAHFEKGRDESLWTYYAHRLQRLLQPYLFWTAVSILLVHRFDLSSPSMLLKDVFLGTGVGVGYFVIVMVQFVLLTPILARIESRKIHIFAMAALFVLGLTYTYVVRLGHPASRLAQFPYDCIFFIVWYPFYHLGFFAAKFRLASDARFRRFSAWAPLLYLALSAAAGVEGIYLHRLGIPLAESQLRGANLLASIALFLFALSDGLKKLEKLLQLRFFQFLGRESYLIYLTHVLFLTKGHSLIRRAPFLAPHQWLDAVLVFVLTLTLSVLLAALVRKFRPWYFATLGA